MAEKRISNNGNCYQCGKTFGKTAMKNHVLKEHNIGDEESFLLKIESAYFKDYWLYIDIPKSKKIEYIDKFLRNIWLECCGHLSRFATSYNSRSDIGKTRTVGSFNAGDEIYYEYDMGTTTALYIKFISEIKRPKQTNSVRLLARNEAPALKCGVCGNTAEFICTECMYDPDESIGSLFCEKHSEQHDHNDMMLPLVNSPRNGECGYDGEQDFYGFTGDLKCDRETSIGKIRRYEWVKTEENDKLNDKTKDTGGFEMIKSNQGSKTENAVNMGMESLLEKLFLGDLNESDLTDDNLFEMFGEFKNNLAIQGKPFFTLKELLHRHTITDLRNLAGMLEIKNYSKLKKDEMIAVIINEIVRTEKLENVFSILPDKDFKLFNDILDKDYFITDENIFQNIFILSAHIFMVFDFEEEYYCVIPREIKEAYKTFANESFLEKRKAIQNLSKYARAAVNLYGIIKTEDFTDIFNSYNNSKKDCENTEKGLDMLSLNGEQYGILNGYLIHGSLYDSTEVSDFVKHLEDLKKNKPYYIPSDEEFIRYENPDYYEETAEVKKFKEHLKKNGFKDAEELEEVILEIMWSMKNGLDKPLDFIRILTETGFEFKSQSMAKKAIESAMEMYSNTRIWINNGYTPNEMGNIEK